MKRKKSKSVSLRDIANALNLSITTVCKVINDDPNYRPSKETKELILKKAQEMGYDTSRLFTKYRRKYERKIVNIPAKITIIDKKTNRIYDRGNAVIKDIGEGGVLITDIRLNKNHLPIKPFICELETLERKFKGVTLIGEPIRLRNNGKLYLGLSFNTVSDYIDRVISLSQRHRFDLVKMAGLPKHEKILI